MVPVPLLKGCLPSIELLLNLYGKSVVYIYMDLLKFL